MLLLFYRTEITIKRHLFIHRQRSVETYCRHFRIELQLFEGHENKIFCGSEIHSLEAVAKQQALALGNGQIKITVFVRSQYLIVVFAFVKVVQYEIQFWQDGRPGSVSPKHSRSNRI